MKVWMRMGDSDNYRDFDSPSAAGYDLGNYLAETGSGKSDVRGIRWRDLGLEVGGFTGYDYVSLFWGDEDAQEAKALTKTEKAQFVEGVYEGGDFKRPVRKAVKAETKPKSRRKSSSPPTSVRGVRG